MIALESIGLKILIWLWYVTENLTRGVYLSHVFFDRFRIFMQRLLSCGGGFVGDGQIWQWQLQEAWIWLGGFGVV